MGIKIVPASKMVNFLESRVNARLEQLDRSRSGASALTTTGLQLINGDETSPSLKMKSVRVVPFCGPFIKVESMESNSRPFYKVFAQWPDFNLDHKSSGCPFRTTTASSRTMHPPPTDRPGHNSRPVVKSGFRKVHLDKKCVKITGTTYAKDRKRNCEICQADFDKLDEVCLILSLIFYSFNTDPYLQHLDTERHKLFVQDTDNYNELFGVIKSLPSLTDLEHEEEDDIYDKICTESPIKTQRLTTTLDPNHGMRCNEMNELSERFWSLSFNSWRSTKIDSFPFIILNFITFSFRSIMIIQ